MVVLNRLCFISFESESLKIVVHWKLLIEIALGLRELDNN